MFWLKACQRCRGDLYEAVDMYGPYIACIQCSHHLSPNEEQQLKFAITSGEKAPGRRHVTLADIDHRVAA